MKHTRKRVDLNLEELDQIIDRGMRTPLNEAEGQKLKTALHAMAERLSWKRSTEKTSAVVDQPAAVPVEERNTGEPAPASHGRHGAPLHLPAQTEFRLRTPHSTPATGARSAAGEKSTASTNRRRGCDS
jgi:hypothetical protein